MEIKLGRINEEGHLTVKLLSRPSNRVHWTQAQEEALFRLIGEELQKSDDLYEAEIVYIPDIGEAGYGLTCCSGLHIKREQTKHFQYWEFLITDHAQYQVRNIAEDLNHFRIVTLTYTNLREETDQ